jgi:hypothetical protein
VNGALARLLTRLYPRGWRERYGREFAAFLEESRGGVRALGNVVWSALCERISSTQGGDMKPDTPSFSAIVKQPAAFLPLMMSIIALGVVLASVAMLGAVRQTDEGTAAHIWQLLIAGQLPLLLFFAVRWLPRAPRQTLYVLGLQAGAVLAAMAPVYFLGL